MNTNLMVRYVGLKDSETDCVAGTGITWTGKGDVQPVPPKAWEIMSRHPDVWELVIDDGALVQSDEPATGLSAMSQTVVPAGVPVTTDTVVIEPEKVEKPVEPVKPVVAKKTVPAKKVAAKKAAAKKSAPKAKAAPAEASA